ncbi:hypothetical protein GCM10008944_01270 [Cytobacillus oceanisediminis]
METPKTSNPRRPRWCDDLKFDRTSVGLLVAASLFFTVAIVGAVTVR